MLEIPRQEGLQLVTVVELSSQGLHGDRHVSLSVRRDHALREGATLASGTSMQHLGEIFPGSWWRLKDYFGNCIAMEEEIMTQSRLGGHEHDAVAGGALSLGDEPQLRHVHDGLFLRFRICEVQERVQLLSVLGTLGTSQLSGIPSIDKFLEILDGLGAPLRLTHEYDGASFEIILTELVEVLSLEVLFVNLREAEIVGKDLGQIDPLRLADCLGTDVLVVEVFE